MVSFLVASFAVLQLNAPVTINVDAAANRHPIDERIYGVAFADEAALTQLDVTLNRWGGNAVSRHNWAISTTNRAKDWFFENIPDPVSEGDGSNGKAADEFIEPTLDAGAQPVITIPMMGFLPFDRAIRCGYSVAKYGAQQATDPYNADCGNGKTAADARMLGVNDPADTSTVFDSSHQVDWIQHLVATWGAANDGGVRYYALDNEPSLWSFDHWDVHPDGSSYDEVWDAMAEYGALIKANDPGALITGIEEWGWSGYFSSGLDQENWNNENANEDRDAHGGVAYVPWLLQQAHSYEETTGVRILDFASLHFYPQGNEFGDSGNTTTPMQLLRNRSTRGLWDPAYLNESWINDYVYLIPRLRQWVNEHYPGTKIGVTEYNWGAEHHINGATTQADILGIFGRERLDMGVRWVSPPAGSHAFHAFQMYRNYDGALSRFGDLSVAASGPDPDQVSTFAALRSSDRKLTVLIVAKVLANDTPVTVNLANFVPTGMAEQWQLTAGNVITQLASVATAPLTVTVPAQSITLLVIPGTWVDAPANLTASATSTSNVGLSWSAVPGASSYNVYRSNGGAYELSGSTPGTTYNDGGRAANTTYLYRVQASNAGVASGFSPIDAATTVMFTDTPLTAGMVARAAHVAELRTAVNAMRAAAGLGAASFDDHPLLAGASIRASHVRQLRFALEQARATIGLAHPAFEDRALSAGSSAIEAAHLNQLRAAAQ